MAHAAFPAAKLGALLLKQISKPIANIVKSRAKNSYFFRTYICMPPAQFYHWWEVKLKMWVMNLGRPINIPPLNEAMAIELGASLLGEGIMFLVAAGVISNEYARSARKEAAKEAARVSEQQFHDQRVRQLHFETEKQRAQIEELSRLVYHLQSHVVHTEACVEALQEEGKTGEDGSSRSNTARHIHVHGLLPRALASLGLIRSV